MKPHLFPHRCCCLQMNVKTHQTHSVNKEISPPVWAEDASTSFQHRFRQQSHWGHITAGPTAVQPNKAGFVTSLSIFCCSIPCTGNSWLHQGEIFFTGDSRGATLVLSPRAIYRTLSFCRGLIISAFFNSFLCPVRHLWSKKVEFAIRQQKMAFLSFITSHSCYLYHKSSLREYFPWNWGQGLLIPDKSVSHISLHWFSVCLKVNSNSNCITLYSNEKKETLHIPI